MVLNVFISSKTKSGAQVNECGVRRVEERDGLIAADFYDKESDTGKKAV